MATIRNAAAVLLLLSGLVSASHAEVTSSQPVQTLDRVLTFSTAGAIQMGFGDPLLRNPDYAAFKAISSSGFTSCQLTATTGLVCLDGRLIRNWKDPKDSSTAETLFSCADERLGLDIRKPDTCTAMTIDTAGNFWIAGKKNSAHSLIKLVPIKNGSCPAPFDVSTDALLGVKGSTAPAPAYCAKEFASGRPLLQDISAVDGDEGKLFPYGSGILGLEERKTLVFFRDAPDTGATSLDDPIVIASGKSGWNLQGSEQIHGSTLLQRTVDTVTDNFALVTTSTGRILQKEIKDLVSGTNTPASSNVFETTLFRGSVPSTTIPGARTKPPACSSTAFYELRASTKTGMLYTTDRAACQIVAFKPTYVYDVATTPAVDPVFTNQANISLTSDTTLLTAYASATYPPDGVTITPGIDVPLANCQGIEGCTLIPDNNQDYEPTQTVPGAKLSRVQYIGTKDNLALFQVQNIPDCRKFTTVELGPDHPEQSVTSLPEACRQFATTERIIITDANGRGRYLNVAPLLPSELTELLRAYGTNDKLPEMLISPEHEATSDRGFTFDAFVGFTDQSLVFRDTFTAQFDISQLLGGEPKSYCGFENEDPDGTGPLTAANTTNLKWDLITTVSERWATVGGPNPGSRTAQKVDMLTNTFCENPTSGSGTRWSMFTYGLQPRDDGQRTYLKWVQRLYAELDETRYRFGCHADSTSNYGNAPISESPVPPLSSATCSGLATDWEDGLFKLNKCIDASIDPKSSAGAENCQSFSSALKGYQTRLNGATYTPVPAGFIADPANRLGELESRLQVLLHVFEDHFEPSIPPGGFGP